jgi:hypothetical protein
MDWDGLCLLRKCVLFSWQSWHGSDDLALTKSTVRSVSSSDGTENSFLYTCIHSYLSMQTTFHSPDHTPLLLLSNLSYDHTGAVKRRMITPLAGHGAPSVVHGLGVRSLQVVD